MTCSTVYSTGVRACNEQMSHFGKLDGGGILCSISGDHLSVDLHCFAVRKMLQSFQSFFIDSSFLCSIRGATKILLVRLFTFGELDQLFFDQFAGNAGWQSAMRAQNYRSTGMSQLHTPATGVTETTSILTTSCD